MIAPGRPKRECRSAQHEGLRLPASGHPKRECRSAQHDRCLPSALRRFHPLVAEHATRRVVQ